MSKRSPIDAWMYGVAILAFYLVVRGWDYIPMVKERKVISSLKVEAAVYDRSIGVLAVRLQSRAGRDVKDIELECHLTGASGTRIISHSFTLYDTLDGMGSVEGGEKIDGVSAQVQSVDCEIVDAIILGTAYGGQDPSGPIRLDQSSSSK